VIRHSITASLLLATFAASSAAAQAEPGFHDAPFDEDHWTFSGPDVRPVGALGQKALRLQDGTATLKIPDFSTGIIEFDVLLASEAPIYTGLRFHGRDKGEYEYFYLRAERSGMGDATQYTPVFNGDQGWQIYSGPEFSSEEGFKRGGWNHVEARIYPDSADIFINGRRSLRITDLKTSERSGYVALTSSFGPLFPFNQVFYANVRYSLEPLARPADMPAPHHHEPAGLVRQWHVSAAMPLADAMALATAKPSSRPATWSNLPVESNGIANLARIAAKSEKNDAAIAEFEVTAKSAGPRMMRFGYSDAVTILVNGKPLFQGDAQFLSRDLQYLGTVGFKDVVAVPLQRGANRISFVVKESYGGWAAAAEFVDAAGLSGRGLSATIIPAP